MVVSLYSDKPIFINQEGDLFSKITDSYEDAIMAQVVNTPVIDCLSTWRNANDEGVSEVDKSVNLKSVFIESGIKSRLHYSCLIIPVLHRKDGGMIQFDKPLNEIKAGSFSVARVIHTSNYERSDVIDYNIMSENFGKPSFYQIGQNRIDSSRAFEVKSTRSGKPYIETVYDYYCDLKRRRYELSKSIDENNTIILKTDINELVRIATDSLTAKGVSVNVEDEVSTIIANRLSDLRANADSSNAYAIDKNNEDVDLLLRDNIDDIVKAVENASQLLSAAADIPISRLLGMRYTSSLSKQDDDKVYSQTLVGLREFMFGEALRGIDLVIARSLSLDNYNGYSWNKFVFDEDQENTVNN